MNPDVDPQTHPYISTGLKESKFGVAFADAPALYRRAAALPNIAVHGIDIHIGSQITELDPYREAAQQGAGAGRPAGAPTGFRSRTSTWAAAWAFATATRRRCRSRTYAAMVVGLFAGRREKLLFEPGRHLVGDAGVLLTRVEYLKPGDPKNFAIVDAAMNDLLRPALYDAWHPVDRGAAPRRRRYTAGTSSDPYAKAATSWRATGRWRSPKETCWPSARRARTAWR